MQHHVAERDAVVERRADDVELAASGRFEAGLGERGELARGDHLGDHHRGGLERLLLLVRIGALRPVLDDQHAEDIAGAQDRHAQERVVDLLAGLGPVRERRVLVRFRQVDRFRLAGDEADEAFLGAQHGQMDGVAVQAFGGVQFQRAVDAQHIDGAHLRHHVGGDQDDDLVETLLRADRLRHHLAEAA